jgi:extracellular elastinolytic metalloproteinase
MNEFGNIPDKCPLFRQQHRFFRRQLLTLKDRRLSAPVLPIYSQRLTNLRMNFFKTLFLLFLPLWMAAQQQTALDIGMRYLEREHKAWGLKTQDIADLAVSDHYTDTHNGVTHLYLIQRHQGIEVYNALTNLHLKKGQVVHSGHRLIADLAGKLNATQPVLDAEQALRQALHHLGLEAPKKFQILQRVSSREMTFDKGQFAREDVPVKLRYQPMPDGKVRLAWDMAIDAVNGLDYWSLRIDAMTGIILDQTSWTQHCSFETGHAEHCTHGHAVTHRPLTPVKEARAQASQAMMSSQGTYRVFPVPVESPAHGGRQLIVNPADPIASPFGWHDTDGVPGSEFNITRGNNAHTFEARDGNNSSKGNEPNGGPNLVFDFPLDPSQEPQTFTAAATVNLFYMINMLHDVSFHFGFTEAAGNFQQTNYTGQGQGGDFVRGRAQFGATNNANLNNADFSTPPDGGSGVMRMFVWDRSAASSNRFLKVIAPSEIAGDFVTGTAAFGPAVSPTPVTGEVRIVQDNTSQPSLGCQSLNNDLTGKIALIDRGGCEFGRKVINAQEKGAIAVIICNFENTVLTMGAGAVGNQSNIPAVMIGSSDCAVIKTYIEQGLVVSLQSPEVLEGPDYLDGTLDNGIVAHEFAHGVSNRLTGGPASAGCLGNQEQMGEGWSDFFSLIFAQREGTFGAQRRGIGTFVSRESNEGRGIRPYPYSTDMITNPFTYLDIRGVSVPHGVGAVWCTMLWDLYWAMSDRHGFDPDYLNPEAGNNKAIQLVMDGMKLQPCNPGFIDGRNAILAADQVNYGGENQCLIWEVFARRGLGVNASQGSSNNVGDGSEDFNAPDCRPELKIRKAVTPLINAGDIIEVAITVKNDLPNDVSDVVVEDLLPANTSLVSGSAGFPFSQVGDALFFTVGTIAAGQERIVTYSIATPGHLGSDLLFFDPCEVEDELTWLINVEPGPVFQPWEIQDYYVKNGQYAWGVTNLDTTLRSDLAMINPVLVTGTQPVMRFTHRYDTEYRADGGFLEISRDYGDNWTAVPSDRLFRGPYNAVPIQYGTFTLPNIYAFSGSSDGWVDTYVDLADYLGEEVMVRFRFGCDGNTANIAEGWFMDDFTIMDMYNYQTEACVSYAEGPDICASAPGRGTVVEHSTSVNVSDPQMGQIQVYPNPARESLYLTIERPSASDIEITLLSLDGRALWVREIREVTYQTVQIPLPAQASGMYLLRVQSAEGVLVEKIVVNP